MPAIAFALPVLPGKEDFDRKTLEVMAGDRRGEYERALREAGITRHAVWHQHTPDGTIAVVYMEAADPGDAAAKFGSSRQPFNRWFRDQMQDVHGIDIAQYGPQLSKVIDMRL